jgi:hypothetical protein
MNRRIWFAIVTIAGFAPACALTADDQGWDDTTVEGPVAAEANEGPGLMPFHVASFDHYPSDAELEGALTELTAKDGALGIQHPTEPRWPAAGQKRVTIIATTADVKDAGTDEAAHVYMRAYWRVNGAQQYNEKFVLNAADRDDLDRDTVHAFYYLMNLSQYAPGATQDQFVNAKIGNTSTDGWLCEFIELRDMNYQGTSRTQSLPFNTWVDSPSVPESPLLNGTSTSWLNY